MGAPLSYAAAASANALEEMLKQKFLEQIQKQTLAERVRENTMQNDVATRGLDQGDRRIGLSERQLGEDTRQFDVSSGQRDRTIKLDEQAQPVRLKHMEAQTGDILRKPQAEQQEREFITGRDTAQHGRQLQEIGARGAEDRRTIASRPVASAGGWQLKEISDPKTNTTKLIRVNDVTGETQEVALPGGFQPGGQRQKNLSVSQQDDLATMETVQKLSAEASKLGDSIGWKGVGGLGQGTVQRLAMQHLGAGDSREEELRNFVGNIQGTIAKLRGGTAFSAQEKAMLDSYTPTINDSPKAIQAKLKSLGTFINAKRDSTMKFAGAGAGPAPAGSGGSEKTVTIAQLQAIAKKRGTTVEQERQRAAAEGFVVR